MHNVGRIGMLPVGWSGTNRERRTIKTASACRSTRDHLIRSHTDEFNISTRTVTCDACRIRKPDVTR